jgi:tetratricopeptide (TPR) repeat protein
VRCAHLAVTAIEAYAGAGGRDGDDVRALAWAELGNAHRICGDLRSAGMAFHHARQRVRDAADPLVRAEVYQIEASYRDYTCEFDRATRLLRRAERLQIRFGTPNAVAVIRILRAEPARRTGRLIEAIDLLQSALGLLDVRDQPRLAIMAVHNLGHCLIDAGAFDAALGILRRFKPAYETFAKPRDRALRTLLEARAVRGAGLVSLAEAMLMEARDRLVELASPYEVVTVDLDLAELYAVENRWTELETIAGETLALCTAYGVGTEALAAAKLLCDAAERRQVTAGNVLGLVARLRDHLAPLTRLA